ncbi:MAG: 4Fe-4S binding protein [Tissierellia bacterium]|nr:4Fe-4S binding protein [Tissierellia bacterium]
MDKYRHWIQSFFAILFNGYGKGWLSGKIYTGPGKNICVPVLNCYSCPGALGSCPIGSLQAVLGSNGRTFSFYVLGTILLFGTILGRLICGFLCPFGWLQDLLYKIPLKKKNEPRIIKTYGIYFKYVFLVLFVFILPLSMKNEFGISSPYFCKYICPAGIIEGALPLMALDPGLRSIVGFLFAWKFLFAISIIGLSMIWYRPFCKYICPLGAIYGLLNRFSAVQLEFSSSKCIHCRKCVKACKMNVEPYKNPTSPECIRCGDCVRACPVDALELAIYKKKECEKVIQ